MDIRELKCFVALAKAKNVDQAAASLCLSPRTLIRLIKALESNAGASLISRTPLGIELTPSGRVLLEHACQITASIEFILEDVKSIDRNERRRFDVGACGTAMFNVIPEICQVFGDAHPEVEVVIHDMPPSQQIESLRQGSIQIAFDRYLPTAQGLSVELVIQECQVVALPTAHELAKHTTVHLSEFRNYPVIGSSNPEWERRIEAWFRPHGFAPRTTSQKAGSIMSAIALVAAGFGIALVPASLQSMSVQNVVFRPLTDAAITIDLHCAFLSSNQLPILAAMLGTVRSYRAAREMAPRLS